MATIKVAVRCRPFSEADKLGVHMVQRGEEDGETRLLNSRRANNRFAFSYSWWSAYGYDRYVEGTPPELDDMTLVNQQMVYDQVGRKILEDYLAGDPIVLFAYGLSGSGKTFTVFGRPLSRPVCDISGRRYSSQPRPPTDLFSLLFLPVDASTRGAQARTRSTRRRHGSSRPTRPTTSGGCSLASRGTCSRRRRPSGRSPCVTFRTL